MTGQQFHNWLTEPASMNPESIAQLREVTQRYPYFTIAQVMLAKNLRSENHIDQLRQLQLAAVMVPNRKVLHQYLKAPVTHQEQIPEGPLQQEIPAIEHEVIVDEPEVQSPAVDTVEEEVSVSRFPDELIPEPVYYQLETADLPEPQVEDEEVNEPEPTALSFSEWLSITSSEGLERSKKKSTETSRVEETGSRSTVELIDHFLNRAEEVPKKRVEFFNPKKVAAKADQGDFSLVSETLANIYFQQEQYELAKKAYEALSLKYPDKSIYFAARLKEIDEKLTS